MTTETPFGATVRPMTATSISFDPQAVWKIIRDLKPSLKAKITKGDNKLRSVMAERNRPSQEAVRAVLDMYAPNRDAIIERAKAERDEAIRIAEDKFQTIREVALAEFNVHAKPVFDAEHEIWKKNHALYLNEWKALVEEVSGQEIA
jgi:hypothetical protein